MAEPQHTGHAVIAVGLLGQQFDADYRIVAVMLGLLLTIVALYLLTRRPN